MAEAETLEDMERVVAGYLGQPLAHPEDERPSVMAYRTAPRSSRWPGDLLSSTSIPSEREPGELAMSPLYERNSCRDDTRVVLHGDSRGDRRDWAELSHHLPAITERGIQGTVPSVPGDDER